MECKEMKNYTFYMTNLPFKKGVGYVMSIPLRWGFEKDDIVDVRLEDRKGDKVRSMKRVCSQSTSKSSGLILYLNKAWDLNIEDYIRMELKLVHRPSVDGEYYGPVVDLGYMS